MKNAAASRASVERRSGSSYADLPAGRSHFDKSAGKNIVKVVVGEHYVTSAGDEEIVTVLGSCVAACIRDPVAGVGGMNHFMLPRTNLDSGDEESSLRYGNVAMERLVNDLMKRGAARDRLEIKIFGGANVIKNSAAIGSKNAVFIKNYLVMEGLYVAAADLQGNRPRRIHYDPMTGKVKRFWLKRTDDQEIVATEDAYAKSLTPTDLSGSVDLFD